MDLERRSYLVYGNNLETLDILSNAGNLDPTNTW